MAYVGLFDLVSAGNSISHITYEVLPVWIVVGVIYLVWITGFSKIMDIVYEKKKIPGVELDMLS